jgi:glycosyltransferase involved in cell wall biosynthesis
MSFHIVTSTVFNFEMFVQRAQEDKGPRHTLHQISQQLDATIHQPDQSAVTPIDKILSKIAGQPAHWALARRLALQLKEEDVVYCAGEDVGIPLAILLRLKPNRPRLAVSVMAPDRFRARKLLKFLGLSESIQLFTVTDQYKADGLKNLMNLSDSRVFVLPEQTDVNFFTPGNGTLPKPRPLIVSAGLEQRDYLTLSRSIQGQDIDVKICAFSPNASSGTRTSMPDPVPTNMEIRYFDFAELRDLYRSADIVVISLLKNRYSAGLTVLMEAMACKSPVIMTRNIGFSSELMDKGLIVGVEPGDEQGLQKAIATLLSDPQAAQAMAQRAYDHFLTHNTSEHYVDLVCQQLKQLEFLEPEAQLMSQLKAS